MKKRMVVLCLVAAMLTGCGGNNKINALDYVELGQYKDLPVTKMSTAVSEEDIDLQIMRLASAGATTEKITDRDVVQEGDVANIDYVGSIDGVEFEGGSAKGYDLEIGSHVFIDGFEEGLVGAKVGDTVDVNVTFPDQYVNNEDLAGKPALFKVTVNYISAKLVPELTDEYVSERTSGQFSTVEDFRQYLREQTEKSLKSYSDSNMNTQLMTQIMDNATLKQDVPAEYIEEKKQSMIRTAKSNAEAYGVSYEEYLSSYLQMDEATFMSTIDESTDDICLQSLVIEAIAQTEGIEVTKDEIAQQIADLMAEYGYDNKKDLLNVIDEADIADNLLEEKVSAFLIENADITEQE